MDYGLRPNPLYELMNTEQQVEFKNAYLKAIENTYLLQANNKILLPFRRMFMIGFKS